MVNAYIEEIPKLYKSGKITSDEASHRITTYFLNNKKIFSISSKCKDSDELKDKTSEIILYLLTNGRKILDHYDSQKASFFNYLYKIVDNQNKCWTRKKQNEMLDKSIVCGIIKIDNEARQEPDPQDECIENMSREQKFMQKAVTKSYVLASPSSPSRKFPVLSTFIKSRNINPEYKARILVSFKNSYSLDDRDIYNLAQDYNLSFLELTTIVDKIRSLLVDKMYTAQEHLDRQYKFYTTQKNYEQQSSMCDTSSAYKANELNQLAQRYKKRWNAHVSQRVRIYPSNRQIAEIIGMKERTLDYYLNCSWRVIEEK